MSANEPDDLDPIGEKARAAVAAEERRRLFAPARELVAEAQRAAERLSGPDDGYRDVDAEVLRRALAALAKEVG